MGTEDATQRERELGTLLTMLKVKAEEESAQAVIGDVDAVLSTTTGEQRRARRGNT